MTLFPNILPPATRRDDPATSRAAERTINRNGQRASHCARVLSVVRKYPRMTAVELLPFCGLERHEVSRRLSDLHSRGEVIVSDLSVQISRERGSRIRHVFKHEFNPHSWWLASPGSSHD